MIDSTVGIVDGTRKEQAMKRAKKKAPKVACPEMQCVKCEEPKLALIYHKDQLYCLDCKREVYTQPTSRGSSPTRKGI